MGRGVTGGTGVGVDENVEAGIFDQPTAGSATGFGGVMLTSWIIFGPFTIAMVALGLKSFIVGIWNLSKREMSTPKAKNSFVSGVRIVRLTSVEIPNALSRSNFNSSESSPAK